MSDSTKNSISDAFSRANGVTWRPVRVLGPISANSGELNNMWRRLQPATKTQTPGGGTNLSSNGVPEVLLALSATQEPLITQGRTVSLVAVSFIRDPADVNFDHVNVWVKGYQGNPNRVLIANGSVSPIEFTMESTKETVNIVLQPSSSSGVTTNINLCIGTSVTLNGVVQAPPAPAINQNLINTPGGYQFTFNQVILPVGTEDVISSYRVYRNTVNTSGSATVVRSYSHNLTNDGTPIVFQDTVSDGTTYFYWVSSVNTAGLESVLTPAQISSVGSTALENARGGIYVVNGTTSVTGTNSSLQTGNSFTPPGWIVGQFYQKGGIVDIFLPDTVTSTAGYMFRYDTRASVPLGQILKVTNITLGASGWALIGTTIPANNAAAITGWAEFEAYWGASGYMQLWLNGALVALATDTTYKPSGVTKFFSEVASGGKLGPGVRNKSGSTHLNGQGSLAGFGPTSHFGYSSSAPTNVTGTISWTWTAFTLLNPDGSSTSVPLGSQTAFTGLNSSTTYYFGIYYDLVLGTPVIVKSDTSSGTQAESNTQIVQVVNADGVIPININVTAFTPAVSGSGGGSFGGGGGGTCFTPNTKVKTQRGDIPIAEIVPGDLVLTARKTWKPVASVSVSPWQGEMRDMGDDELSTPRHLVLLAAWDWVEMHLLHFPTVRYEGTVHNLHINCEAEDDGTGIDTEHSYTLSNGLVVHNQFIFC